MDPDRSDQQINQNGCDDYSKLCSLLTGEQQGVSRDPVCDHN
jgi:hypothetical protein